MKRFRGWGLSAVVPALVLIAVALSGCDSPVGAGDSRFVVGAPSSTSDAASHAVGAPTPLTGGAGAGTAAPQRQVGGTYPGTGRFVNAAAAPAPILAEGLPGVDEGAVTLNFVDTDLREVVKAVVGDILGLNYVIDPAVQGTVTMQTSRPLGRAELLAAMEQVLTVNGAAMVEVGGLYKIVPADRAASAGAAPSLGGPAATGGGTNLTFVPLRHVSATEMAKVLEPFAPPNTLLRVDADRNIVAVGGTHSQRAELLELVRMFDVDWLAGMSYAIEPVETTSAKNMVKDLQKVFRNQEGGPGAGLVEFVPIERLNAVLVISPRRQYLAKAATWIKRLDVGDSAEPRVYVYYVQNSRAEELADVLGRIFGGLETSTLSRDLAPGLTPTEITSNTGYGSRLGSRSTTTRAAAGDGGMRVAQLDSDAAGFYQVTPGAAPPASGAAAPTPQTARSLRAVSESSQSSELPKTNAVRIIPDPVKNALVIQATPQDYRKIQSVLEKLDIQSLQVLIEATFIEVSLTDALTYGTEWYFQTGSSTLELDDLLGSAAGTAGFFSWSLVMNGGNLRVTLQALQELTELTVVSSPNLMVLDNQEAHIQVGGEQPVPTQSRQSITDADSPIVSNIEYRDVGTILSVTPRVNEGGLVTLEIDQEVSNVQNEEVVVGGTTAPSFNQRTISSTIAVHDGESVVLGGQIFEDKEKTRRGVPYLSQIPVVGFLFGTHNNSQDRTELLVIITPHVVRDEGSARMATETLNRRMQLLRPQFEKFRIREGLDGT